MILFKDTSLVLNADNFYQFCSEQMKSERCSEVFDETKEQSVKAEWYYQRFARITASRLYEVCRCQTNDGSLVGSIMGARGFKGNKATKRVQVLESEIFEQLKRQFYNIKQCGVVIRPDMTIFAASPDGISDSHIFEIKCPSKKNRYKLHRKRLHQTKSKSSNSTTDADVKQRKGLPLRC